MNESNSLRVEKFIRDSLPKKQPKTEFIPLHEPYIGAEEAKSVSEVVTSGWISTQGSARLEAEALIAQYGPYLGVIATNSGTSALHLALEAMGVGMGDSVVIPSLTFAATANAVLYTGAKPVVIDVEPENYSIDPVIVREFLQSCDVIGDSLVDPETGLNVKAIVVVHILGLISDLRELRSIADEFHVALIEDAAEALGSMDSNGFGPGHYSDAAIFSFNGNKTITSGGGGALASNTETIIERARHLATVAKSGSIADMSHDAMGFNYLMPAINAGMLISQMCRLNEILDLKKHLGERYLQESSEYADLFEIKIQPNWNRWLIHIRFLESIEGQAGDIATILNREGIGVRPLWRPMHKLDYLGAHCFGKFPISELATSSILCLPSSPCWGERL